MAEVSFLAGKKGKATAFALLAAALYAISTPFSKLLLNEVSEVMMAALLYLGAARTSTYYAAAPFIGSAISLAIFRTVPSLAYLIALAIMIAGTYLSASDTKA